MVLAPKLTSCCSIIDFAPFVIATRIITEVIPMTIPNEVNKVLDLFLNKFDLASEILSRTYLPSIS